MFESKAKSKPRLVNSTPCSNPPDVKSMPCQFHAKVNSVFSCRWVIFRLSEISRQAKIYPALLITHEWTLFNMNCIKSQWKILVKSNHRTLILFKFSISKNVSEANLNVFASDLILIREFYCNNKSGYYSFYHGM